MTDPENALVPRRGGKAVDPDRGIEWLKQGWDLFMRNPGVWIAISLIALIIFLILGVIPLVGHLAATLLGPVLGAGMLMGCRALHRGEELRVDHLFAGFQQNAGNLVLLGVIALAGTLIIGLVAFGVVGGGALTGAIIGHGAGIGVAAGGLLAGSLVFLALTVPLTMALWFAPALVVFQSKAPIDAVKTSFDACLKNVLAFLIYGVMLLVLGLLAFLPLGLGFLVLLPVVAGSVHAAFVEIFEAS